MAINTYNTVESGNIALGQGGSVKVTGAYAPDKAKVVAIFALADSNVTTTGLGQVDLAGETIKEGWTVLGNWESINVTSGKVIAYLG